MFCYKGVRTEKAVKGGFVLCFAEWTVVIGLILVGFEFGANATETG